MEIYGKYIESRRNHERRESASSTAGAKQERERVEFTQTSFSFLFCIAVGNACALSAEDSKGEALSEADLGLRSSQSRQSMTISHLSALSWCVSYPTPRPYKRNT